MTPPKSDDPKTPAEPDGAYSAPGRAADPPPDEPYCAPGREAAGREAMVRDPYFAPGPEALKREQARFVIGGGPTEDEMRMALEDLEDALRRLEGSGILSPTSQSHADMLRAKDQKK